MCAQICECMWKPEVHVGIFPNPVLCVFLGGGAEYFTEPRAYRFGWTCWPVSSRDLSVHPHPRSNQCRNCKRAPLCSAFYIGSEDLNSGLHTPKTTFYYGLSYLPNPRLVSGLLSVCGTSFISDTERNRPRLTAQRPIWGDVACNEHIAFQAGSLWCLWQSLVHPLTVGLFKVTGF